MKYTDRTLHAAPKEMVSGLLVLHQVTEHHKVTETDKDKLVHDVNLYTHDDDDEDNEGDGSGTFERLAVKMYYLRSLKEIIECMGLLWLAVKLMEVVTK